MIGPQWTSSLRLGLVVGVLLLAMVLSLPGKAEAILVDPIIVAGAASIAGLGTSQVTITQQAPQVVVAWRSFNISSNEVVRYVQPSSSSIALNRIFDVNPTFISGGLQSNGSIILVNPTGIRLSSGSQFDVGGLTASTMNITNQDFLSMSTPTGITLNGGTISLSNAGIFLSDGATISVAGSLSVSGDFDPNIVLDPNAAPNPVPLPGTLLLMGFGIAAIAGVIWKGRTQVQVVP
jgi:filamentous hemagglutinin family protein